MNSSLKLIKRKVEITLPTTLNNPKSITPKVFKIIREVNSETAKVKNILTYRSPVFFIIVLFLYVAEGIYFVRINY